jgi:hypothetical protein
MTPRVREAVDVLERTPGTLQALLGGLPEGWLAGHEGPGRWNAAEVVAHLADLEEVDWIPRLLILLADGGERRFEPVDRERFRTALAGRALPELLDLFAERRAANLEILRSLDLEGDDLVREGTHPTLGRVTLAELVAAWAVHDLNHLAQIVRVLAKRYRDAVGPWREVLAALRWTTGP